MKSREQFYKENLETIRELEDKVYDLTEKMKKECGKQSFTEKLNLAWSYLYETVCDTKEKK